MLVTAYSIYIRGPQHGEWQLVTVCEIPKVPPLNVPVNLFGLFTMNFPERDVMGEMEARQSTRTLAVEAARAMHQDGKEVVVLSHVAVDDEDRSTIWSPIWRNGQWVD